MKNLLFTLIAVAFFISISNGNNIGDYVKAPFPIDLPENVLNNQKISFGYLTVPEFHSNPNGNTMEIAVATFHCRNEESVSEPLLMLSGGPGESNIATFTKLLCGEFGKVLCEKRDVILIEIRGTYYSKPSLICPEIFECEREMLEKDLSGDEMFALMKASVLKTNRRFEKEGINLNAFNNNEIADDINLVMTTLGFDKYNVFGFSAGTVTVQYLLKKYPEHIHSATMSGVVSLKDNVAASGSNTVATLENIFDICKNDIRYRAAYPDLENRFLSMLDSLNQHPATVELKDKNGDNFTYSITGDKISRWLAFGMYMNNQIPATIDKLLKGDFSQMTSTLFVMLPQKTFSHGLSFSIMTSDFSKSLLNDYPYNQKYKTFYHGLRTAWHSPQFNNELAKIWNVDSRDISFEKIKSDVPTLMFCGELDHVCPPKYAEEIALERSNSYVHIFKGLSHTQVVLTPEFLRMMNEFCNNPAQDAHTGRLAEYKTEFKMN